MAQMENNEKLIAKYEKSTKNYKSVKTSLKTIVKDKNIINDINKTVFKMNKIVVHTYQFLKLYYMHQFEKGNDIPIIDNKFIMMINLL
jgi:hypothetical protein